ncbi:MAG: biotin--[acetyl-CoA-carboxylase] ligase [Desulfobulbaceae bacterium]|jgi:BirA family biotin operon repressor/biotin-[acetyl-CoA-carboxylase] ligase|nr:biotin--[acetyl-CoA-carboxylase] ligase [Desulfobulbaceae bacterium]
MPMTRIHIIAETESTNDDALKMARHGAEHGAAVLAFSQFHGRGRLGKTWYSPAGAGLYGSIVLRPRLDRTLYPRLTLLAGVAVALALEERTGLAPRLKWPNDLYLNDRKCGGILTEAVLTGTGDYVVVGIGINLVQFSAPPPEEIRGKVGTLWRSNAPEQRPEFLFAAIHKQLLRLVREYETRGFARIIALWRSRDGFCGRRLAWAAPNSAKITGTSHGIDEEGDLLLVDEKHRTHKINCGDVQPAAI